MPKADQLRENLALAETQYKAYGKALREARKLVSEADRRAPQRPTNDPVGSYEKHRQAMADKRRAESRSARDIGDLPAVANPERKAACRTNFRLYLETYHKGTFPLEWSEDHLKVITKIERAVRDGGLFAMAMPRGSGKTSLCVCAAVWALVYGLRQFVALIGAEAASAGEMLQSIRIELETNAELSADFPEVCYPIQRLDGIVQRRLEYKGKPIRMVFDATTIALPTMPHSAASGGIVQVAGITGRVRGMHCKRADGTTVRPDFVILDDPQTDESARSRSQCVTREKIVSGAVLGLAGPGKKIAGVMPCTVIQPGDMADNLLDRDKHPEWQGERTRMVYAFPTNEKLWETYHGILRESLKAERGIADATAFYLTNQEAMDAGARIAWPARFNHDEISAVQNAMNLLFRDEAAFWAEYQNQPLPEVRGGIEDPKADDIAALINRRQRGVVPIGAQHVTAMIDVQDRVLFWTVCAWEPNFTGYVLDYGTFPDQQRSHFTYADCRATLANTTPAIGLEAQIHAGLEILTKTLLGHHWLREDGAQLRVERCLVDANYQSDTIYGFCAGSAYPTIITPSHGKYVGARSQPFSEYKQRPGDRVGHNWRQPNVQGRRAVRYTLFDSNWWKTFIYERFRVGVGGRGSLSLFGDNPALHRLFGEHVTAEFRTRTSGRGREVDEWQQLPGRPDNHWLDTLVGCAVGASMQGVALDGQVAVKEKARKKVSIPEHMRRG